MASLIRSQRRLAVGVCATVVVLLVRDRACAGVSLPGWADLRLFGIPLPWAARSASPSIPC